MRPSTANLEGGCTKNVYLLTKSVPGLAHEALSPGFRLEPIQQTEHMFFAVSRQLVRGSRKVPSVTSTLGSSQVSMDASRKKIWTILFTKSATHNPAQNVFIFGSWAGQRMGS